jgi:hypothetical protein
METNKMNEVITFKSVEEFENWITNEWAVLVRSKFLKAMDAIMAQPEMKSYHRYLKKGAKIPDKLSKDFQITWNCEKKIWNEELNDWVKTPMTDGELIRWDNRNEDEMYSSGFYFEEVTNSTRYYKGEYKPIILNKGNLFLCNLCIEMPTIRLELPEGSSEFVMPTPSLIWGANALHSYSIDFYKSKDFYKSFVASKVGSILKPYHENNTKLIVDNLVEKIVNSEEVRVLIENAGIHKEFVDADIYSAKSILRALQKKFDKMCMDLYDSDCRWENENYIFLRGC